MKTATRICGPILFLGMIALSQACRSGVEVKEKIVGTWEESKGARETLEFKADGTLLMKSPGENRTCEYSFPDSRHIRLDCTMVAGGPRTSQTYGFSMTADRVMISDELETGTYKRVQDAAPTPAAGNQ